jgi:hypothetical protein
MIAYLITTAGKKGAFSGLKFAATNISTKAPVGWVKV